MTGASESWSRSRHGWGRSNPRGLPENLPPGRRKGGFRSRSLMARASVTACGFWQFGTAETGKFVVPWLTSRAGFDHKGPGRARPLLRAPRSYRLHGADGPDAAVPRPARIAIDTGECPEWQRELTVNQPPHGFAGSSPASPTIHCLSAPRDFSRTMDPIGHCFPADYASKYMGRIWVCRPVVIFIGSFVVRDPWAAIAHGCRDGAPEPRLPTSAGPAWRWRATDRLLPFRRLGLRAPAATSQLMPRKRSILKINTKNSTFSDARFFFMK